MTPAIFRFALPQLFLKTVFRFLRGFRNSIHSFKSPLVGLDKSVIMGNQSSSVIEQCLTTALGGSNADFYATAKTPLYQLSHVRPYNLDVSVKPAAITYPKTADQVAAVVKCAAQNNLKVQARSGGHSFQNYCMHPS